MFNKIILVGNLTRDVELRYLNTGMAVATIGLASNRRYKRQDGSQVDDTCFVDITLFGRTAEIANQYLKKGSKILVEGRLHFETWNDQQGNKRSKHSVIAESMQMLDSRPQGEYKEYNQNSYDNNGYGNYNVHYNNQHSNQSHTYPSNQSMDSNGNHENSYQQNNLNSNLNKNKVAYPEPPEIDIDEIPF